jgi:hypothetical protein
LNSKIPKEVHHAVQIEDHLGSRRMQMTEPLITKPNSKARREGPVDFNDPPNMPSNVLARSGSHTLLMHNKAPGKDGFKEEFKINPNRLTVYDKIRFNTEYGDTIANPENTYMPEHKPDNRRYYNPNLPGMTRCLDFTPSTDQGQKYMDSLSKMPNIKESTSYGYAPAYMQI